jgi:hypothetical protein
MHNIRKSSHICNTSLLPEKEGRFTFSNSCPGGDFFRTENIGQGRLPA